jgi:hypothetical protein
MLFHDKKYLKVVVEGIYLNMVKCTYEIFSTPDAIKGKTEIIFSKIMNIERMCIFNNIV